MNAVGAGYAERPLVVTQVDAFVLRSPNEAHPPERYVQMSRVGSMTSGVGLAARLDHASPVRSPGYQQTTLVKVSTDQGIVGWGECHAPAAPGVHRTVITDLLAPVIVGQDARNVEALWERMYSTQRLRGYATGFFMEAMAGVDIALWDALGKHVGLPVYQLLGGRYRDSIPTYTGVGGATIDELIESARRAIDDGFPAVKLGLSKGHGTRDLDRVAAVSDVVQQKGQVLVDSLGGYKISEALAVGRRLDSLGNIGWWEDPLMPEDVDGYVALTSRLDLPICLGEEISNRFQFRDMASRGAMNITNPDVCRSGGITESRRIAMIADLYGMLWSPHVSMGSAVYISASLHLAVATPNAVIMEGGNAHLGPFGNPLLKRPLDLRPGCAFVPDGPGLGIEFDQEALREVMAG